MGDVANIDILKQYGKLVCYSLTKPNEVIERLVDAEVLITCKVFIDAQIMQYLPKLKLICVAATGTNNIDVVYAQSKGIQVKNVVRYSTNSVAQSTFALLLSLLNHTRYYDDYVKNGSYGKNNMFTHMGRSFIELSGKKFGVIGLGNIGSKVASIAEAFGCEVVYYSTSGENINDKYQKVSLEKLLKISDIVSIHCPLNDNTRNLITYERLKMMKPWAVLLNMARGGIVNEADLAKALNEDIIAGACFDVYSKEPIEDTNPLLQVVDTDKIIFSPHSAWTSIEARTKLIELIAENINAYIEACNR
jgi:lactate dehydrogenase-like 2-hydroxyacid dehydrogenase